MATTRLTRTLGTPTNRKKLTASMWLKKSFNGSEKHFFGMGTSGGYLDFRFASTDELELYHYNSGYQFRLTTTRKFRDNNAWYHLVFSIDTTLGTADDRFKVYVNGVQETVFTNRTNPSQDYELGANVSSNTISVGNYGTNTGNSFDGLMSHVHFIDGTAYDATAFGEYDANGVWKINTSPSVTYGTNGFFILKDGNSVTDQSGNSNNFTVAGGTLINTEDSPSNVFATLNPLDNFYPAMTLSNGNTRALTVSGKYTYTPTTLGMTSGKYYAEIKCTAQSASQDAMVIGITSTSSSSTTSDLGSSSTDWGYYANGDGTNGQYRNNSSLTSYGDIWTTNDIIGIAIDLDNNKLYFSKNGTWQNSGDPTSGATGTGAISITDVSLTPRGAYFFAVNNWSSTTNATFDANFGNGYFGTTAVASAGTNASGIGIFEYDVPTGYTALSTKGLNL